MNEHEFRHLDIESASLDMRLKQMHARSKRLSSANKKGSTGILRKIRRNILKTAFRAIEVNDILIATCKQLVDKRRGSVNHLFFFYSSVLNHKQDFVGLSDDTTT